MHNRSLALSILGAVASAMPQQPMIMPPVNTPGVGRSNHKDRHSGLNRLSQKGRRKRARWPGDGRK